MHIQIKEFSGPLDLLLQLIRREEMDIFDIDIHKITEQYLNFIKENAVMDLDSAGDFIRMAALLIYIKSKSLFPSAEGLAETEAESEEALQKQLVHSLLKMRAVQAVAGKLKQHSLLNRDLWSAGGQMGQPATPRGGHRVACLMRPKNLLEKVRLWRKVIGPRSLIV